MSNYNPTEGLEIVPTKLRIEIFPVPDSEEVKNSLNEMAKHLTGEHEVTVKEVLKHDS